MKKILILLDDSQKNSRIISFFLIYIAFFMETCISIFYTKNFIGNLNSNSEKFVNIVICIVLFLYPILKIILFIITFTIFHYIITVIVNDNILIKNVPRRKFIHICKISSQYYRSKYFIL